MEIAELLKSGKYTKFRKIYERRKIYKRTGKKPLQ